MDAPGPADVRLWSLHPDYLDARGLVALWREALLAQKVLRGETRGYRRHPQLERFRAAPEPLAAIASYLRTVADEGDARGYRFDRSRIGELGASVPLDVTRGQLRFEWEHLKKKLDVRDPDLAGAVSRGALPRPHPVFRVVPGPVAEWERGAGGGGLR